MTRDLLELELAQHDVNDKLHWFEVDRRDFLKIFGGGMLVCLARPSLGQESGRRGHEQHELPKEVSAWIHIAPDGKVTVNTGKVEVGQNIRTSLAQQVAEELRTDFASIEMIMGDTDLVPWDMGTFGSRTTPTMGPELRTMAMAARDSLVELAAKQWSVPVNSLRAENGKVVNPATKQTISYGELTRGQQIAKVVDQDPPFTPATEWKVAGKPEPKADGREFVTGEHKYPSDINRPGMIFGKVLRPSAYKATLASVDTSAAEKISGVQVVRDGDFVGVASADPSAAEKAVATIKAKWNEPGGPSNANIFEYFKNNHEPDEEESGKPPVSLPPADVKLEQRYTVQYIAHAPLEPRAAVAEWNGDKLTVWTGTQRPFAVRDELAEAFHIPNSKVRVIQPDMGSGYGGKHTGDAAVEAARLAKSAGKPVKVVWTREEEFEWAYLRPAGLIEISSGVRRDGTLVHWSHINYNSGSSGIETPYRGEQILTQFRPTKTPLRQGSYRGLASTANNFARESHMDELAHELKMDPLEFRLKNLGDERLKTVYQAAAEKFGWNKVKSAPERGFGFGGGKEKGGHVATCAEVAIDPKTKRVKIVRVVQAWESGAIINPNGLRNQNMGALIMAIGGAMFEAIRFGDSKLENPHFAEYRLPRFSDAPKVEIVLIDRKDLAPAGAGETGIMGLAPAVANAIFAATGTRLRNLPMMPEKPVPGIEPPVFRT
ncbi:MAG TPA: molybdopterin cofactor-binding domain-containing protein [Candidatus Koribacter sp.]|jgi:isoquinoline 1-oxidoreductase